MALNIALEENIFPHSRDFSQGGGIERIGQSEVVVSLDGTGDTDSIQEAIDMIGGGGDIFIKEGEYKITQTITINKDSIKITGTGKKTKIITTANHSVFTASGDNLIFRDLYIYGMGYVSGPPNSNNTGITITSTTGSLISNLWFENMGGVSIYTTVNGIRLVIENCNFENNFATAIDGVDYDNCRIVNNYIKNVQGASMSGIKLGTVSTTGCDNNTITGNIIDTTTFNGIYIQAYGTRNRIIGNHCSNCERYGIEEPAANNDKNIILGNVCHTNTTGQILTTGAATIAADNVVT